MTDKQIIIDGINVSELTGEQLVCMNRYEVARLFSKLVDVIIEIEDDYNNAQDDRVRMWTDNTGLTEKLKRKEKECEELKKNVEHWKMEHKEAKAKGEWTYDLVKKRLGQQLDQLKQTLAEMKEHFDEECELCRANYVNITDEVCEECETKYMLQKINEVLNDRQEQ